MSEKDQKFYRKLTFDIPKVMFLKELEKKTSNFSDFLRQTGQWEPTPPKMCKYFLQILNPVNNAEILAPALVGYQSEMVL